MNEQQIEAAVNEALAQANAKIRKAVHRFARSTVVVSCDVMGSPQVTTESVARAGDLADAVRGLSLSITEAIRDVVCHVIASVLHLEVPE